MMRMGQKQNGVVLISVLWVIAGLSIIVASSQTAVRTEIQLTRTHLRLAQARASSEAGIYWAIYTLLEPRDTAQPGVPKGPVELDLGNARVELSIENDAGKIDINTAGIRLIESALIRAGMDRNSARNATDELERSRQQADDDRAEEGSESEQFQSVEDFTSGLDVPLLIKKRLASRLTVYNRREGINPLAADREILLAVPGMSEGRVDTYLEQRQRQPFRTPDPGFDDSYFTDRLSAVYTITARTIIDGAVSTIGSRVKLSSLRESPFEILEWRSVVDFRPG